MKKLMPPKRLTRYLLAATLLTGLFIYGCKKELKETFASGNPVIEEAKSWYETEYPGNPTSGKNIIQDTKSTDKEPLDFTHKIKPDWKHFANYKRLGKDVIEMPIDSQSKMGAEFKNMTTGGIYSDKKYNRTYFLLLKDSTGYKAYVMMIMADPAYVNNDFSKLSHNTYQKHDADFSGLILYFTPKGRYLGGYKYVNGQLIMPGANVATNQVQNVAGQNSKTVNTVTDCYSFFLITYYTDGTTDELYLGTICNGPCNQSIKGNGCPTGGDGSGGGGSPGNPPPPPNCNPYSPINQSLANIKLAYVDNGDTGAPPPTDPCAEKDIVNSVRDTCLHAMVDNAINKNVNTQISALISSVFGVSNTVNIEYTDLTTLPNGVEGRYLGFNMDSYGNINLNIALNRNSLPTASEEFITTVIMHESLHAYLSAMGTDINSQHEDIIQNYIGQMASSLKQLFPNLNNNSDDAKNLTLGGLQLTNTFKNTIKVDMRLSGNYDAVQLAYSIGSAGTRCKTR